MAKRPQASKRTSEPGVGYGRPPVAHRFKPGKSGSPSGRRKGVRNLKSDLADELSEEIVIQEAGRAAIITKQRAFIKRLCAKALSGDPRAMAQLASLTLRLMPAEVDDSDHVDLDAADAALIERFLARSAAPAAPRARQRA